MSKYLMYFVLIAVVALTCGCAGPEEKKMKFFDKGQVYFEQQEYKKAGLEYKNALQIDPKFTEAYYQLALCELKEGNLKNAFANFRKVVEQDEQHVEAQYQLAKLLFAAQQPDQAEEKINLILATDPEHRGALIMKGALLQKNGLNNQALIHLRGLLEKGITDADVYLLLALVHKTMKNHEREGQVLLDGLERHPDHPQLLMALSDFQRQRGNLSEAITLARKLVELQPDTAGNYSYLASLQNAADDQQGADETLRKLIESDPTDTDSRLAVARFYLSQQNPDKAESVLQEGLEALPLDFALNKAMSGLYLATERRDQALALLEKLAAQTRESESPDYFQAKTELAKIYLANGEIDKARDYADEVIAEKSDVTDAHFVRGRIYLNDGDALKAISEFRPVVTASPAFVPGYLALAEAYTRNGENNLALDTLRNAKKVDPRNRAVRLTLARLLAGLQKHQQAIEELEELRASRPDDREVAVVLADVYMAVGNYTDADEVLTALMKESPDEPFLLAKKAELSARQKQWDRASGYLLKALKKVPDSADLHRRLVQIFINAGQFGKASEHCRQQLKTAETSQQKALFEFLSGHVLVAEKKYANAERAYARAVELYPEWPSPQEALVKVLLAQRKPDEARVQLEQMIEDAPERLSAYLMLGQIYHQKGERSLAVETYEKALKQDPEFSLAANDLAFILSEEGASEAELKRASALARQAQRAAPEDPRVLDTLGWVLYRQGQAEQGLMYVRQALNKDPQKAVLNYHLGRILYDQGQLSQAKDHLEVALNTEDPFMGREDAKRIVEKIQ